MGQNLTSKILDSVILNGVSVVTSIYKDKKAGLTASWFAQISFSPVLLMISIAPQRHTYSIIKQSNIFNVNVLSNNQIDIARHFGLTSGHTIDKFEKIMYSNGKNGAPVLPDTKAQFECNLLNTYVAGDHNILIGEVTNFIEDKSKTPLLFKGTDYW